jgi:hypothetical protein
MVLDFQDRASMFAFRCCLYRYKVERLSDRSHFGDAWLLADEADP